MDQQQKTQAFRDLHQKNNPLILFNIWDPGSARAVAAAGAKALATGSAPVAMSQGYKDGENIPLEASLDNFARIAAQTDLPVTLDIEGGYGAAPEQVADAMSRGLEAGAIGFNFEDQIVGGEGLYALPEQVTRVEAAAAACATVGAFLNARTDIFLKAPPDTHNTAMLDEAITRAEAYQKAGADGFFAPGLHDERLIGTLCEAIDLPVNILALPGAPDNARLAELGVSRISYGPVPFRNMTKWLEAEAKAAMGG